MKSGKIIKIVIGILILTVLIAISIDLILTKGNFKVPLKFYVLFGILLVAIIGYKKKIYWLRYITLLVSLAYLGFYEAGCLCSNGSLESIFMYLGSEKTARIGMNLFRISLLAGTVYYFGNVFCGWVCPKGAIQDFIFKEKLAIKVPQKLDGILKNFRYLLLILIIFYPLIYHKRIFNKIDPFKMVFNFTGATYILIFMVIVLVASIFIYRPFCRYFCPLGAFLGILNRLGIFKLQLADSDNCSCSDRGGICEKKCPMQTITRKNLPIINKQYCISCLECEKNCPSKIIASRQNG